MPDPGRVHRDRPRLRGGRPRGRPLTTAHERSGALEAVERLVNRGGEGVVAEVLAVLERLYRSVAIRDDGTIAAEGSVAEDDPFLERVATLISAHVRRG